MIEHLEGRPGSPYRAESRAGRRGTKQRSGPGDAGDPGFLPPIDKRGQGLGDPFGPEQIRQQIEAFQQFEKEQGDPNYGSASAFAPDMIQPRQGGSNAGLIQKSNMKSD